MAKVSCKGVTPGVTGLSKRVIGRGRREWKGVSEKGLASGRQTDWETENEERDGTRQRH